MAISFAPVGGSLVDSPAGGNPPRRRNRHARRLAWAGFLFVLPAALYTVVFCLVPVVYGLYLSLTDYNPISRSGPQFIGLGNFGDILTDPKFLDSLRVTGTYVLLVLPALLILALGLALMVNRPFRGVGFFRSALYIPHIVSLTAVSMVWLWMYSQNGFINDMLDVFGWGPQSWLLKPDSALPAVAVMRIWKALGSNMVLLLAGLQTIPADLYEAAKVDGASAWHRFRYVTLPGLAPMLVYVIAMDIIFLAQSFAEIFVLTGGGPLGSTTVANYLIYTEAFQYNSMGTASAMAVVLFALIAGVSLVSVRNLMKRSA